MNCKLTHKKTGEPKLFFRNENGQEFKSIKEVLNHSSSYYTTGVYNGQNNFVELAQIPRHSIDTFEGRLEEMLKEGILKTKTVDNKQVFQIDGNTDLQIAENKETAKMVLNLSIGRNNYELKGDNIIITNKYPDTSKMSFGELKESFGEETAENIYLSNLLQHPTETEKQKTKYSKKELKIKLEGLLNKMGFSTTSVANYIENYKTRNHIDPDAKALIDTTQKIVAFKDGKITLEELTEEVAHLIVEGTANEKLLADVVNTEFYKKNEAKYREAYKRQNPNFTEEQVEELVRKEALAKYIANHLFNGQATPNYREENFLNRILRVVSEFIRNIFVNNEISNSLKEYAKDIENHLYNESLDLDINTDVVMYSLPDDFYFNNVLEEMSKMVAKIQSSYNVNTKHMETAIQLQSAVDMLRLIASEVSATKIAVERKDNDNAKLSDLEISKIELLDSQILPTLLRLQTAVKNKKIDPTLPQEDIEKLKRVKETFAKEADKVAYNMHELNTIKREKNSALIEEVINKVMDRVAPGVPEDDRRTYIRLKLESIAKDHSLLFNYFAPFILSSNIYAKTIGFLIKNIYSASQIDFNRGFEKYAEKIKNLKTKDVVRGSFLRSFVKSDEREEARNKDIYDLIKANLPEYLEDENEKEISFEDFVKGGLRSKYPQDVKMQINLMILATKYEHYVTNGNKKQIPLGKLTEFEKSNFEKMLAMTNRKSMTAAEIMERGYLIEYLLYKDNFVRQRRQVQKDYSPSDPSYAAKMQQIKSNENKAFSPIDPHASIDHIDLEDFTELKALQEMLINGLSIYKANHKMSRLDVKFKDSKDGQTFYIRIEDGDDLNAVRAYYALREKEYYQGQNFENNVSNLKDGFEKFKNSLSPNLSDKERILKEVTWFTNHVNFSLDDLSFGPRTTKVTELKSLNPYMPQTTEDYLSRLEAKINTLNTKKNTIIKNTAHFKSFNEYNPNLLSLEEKSALETIEVQLNELRSAFNERVRSEGLQKPQYNSKVFAHHNLAFREDFENDFKHSYEDSTHEERRKFFFSIASDQARAKYQEIENDMRRKRLSEANEDYLDSLIDPNASYGANEDEKRLHALMVSLTPSYYKRYDNVNSNYNQYINDLVDGRRSVDSVISDMERGTLPKHIEYSISPVFSSEREQKTQREYFDEYINAKTKAEKIQILKDIQKLDEVPDEFLDKSFDDFLNSEKGDAYLSLIELRMETLIKHGMESGVDLFLLPQYEQHSLEKNIQFLTGKDKLAQIKDFLTRGITYRPDEYEDAYKQAQGISSIPKYGYYRLDSTEMSRDISYIYFRHYRDAAVYEQRKSSYGDITAVLEDVKGKVFSNGKLGSETHLAKGAEELIAQHIFGKRAQQHYEINLFGTGVKLDVPKLALKLKSFVSSMGVGGNPVVAATAFTTAKFQEYLLLVGGDDFYKKAWKTSTTETMKIISGSIKDINSPTGDSKMERILRWSGINDPLERATGNEYGKFKNFTGTNALFSGLRLVTAPIEAKIAIGMMMEYRVISGTGDANLDGKVMNFTDFRNYLNVTSSNPMSRKEMAAEFDKHEKNNLYNLIDNSTKEFIDVSKVEGLSDAQMKALKESMTEVQARVINKASDLNRKITAQSSTGMDVLAKSNPVLSFLYTYRSWLTNAGIWLFQSGEKNEVLINGKLYDRNLNFMTGNFELGSLPAMNEYMANVRNLFKEKGFQSLVEAYKATDDVGRKAIRETLFSAVVVVALVGLAILANSIADDDDEEDNYLLQFGAYLINRTTNEVFSGNTAPGVVFELLSAVNQPVTTMSTVYNIFGLMNPFKAAQTYERGNYKGWNKYLADLHKITFLRNLNSVADGESIKKTRQAYNFFNAKDNVISPIQVINLYRDTEK